MSDPAERPRFCPICNRRTYDTSFTQFGKQFCSQEHLDMYAAAEKERLARYEEEEDFRFRQLAGG